MPRDFFHTVERTRVAKSDTVGTELADEAQAYTHAVAKARAVKQAEPRRSSWSSWVIRVEDALGEMVMLVPFPMDVPIRRQ